MLLFVVMNKVAIQLPSVLSWPVLFPLFLTITLCGPRRGNLRANFKKNTNGNQVEITTFVFQFVL